LELFLGIDLGTTGLKSMLADETGNIIGSEYRSYPLNVPQIGYAEQNPDTWYQQMCSSIRDLLAKTEVQASDIKCVGLSGQMHGMVTLGKDKRPLRSAIIHCDGRAARQKQKLFKKISIEALGNSIQNQFHSGFQALSLMWIKENQPDLYAQVRHVLLPKDFLRFQLVGNIATEVTDAGGTLMFDNINLCWSQRILNLMGVDSALLPEAHHYPSDIAGTITKKAAEDTGLREGTLVSYGGGDQTMQAVGNGLLSSGNASVNLGTSGQVFVATENPVYDKLLRTHTFCHAQKGTWYVMGAVLNACLSFNWFLEEILETSDFKMADKAASQIAPGAGGLIFLPYLTGERTPHMNEHARAVFMGLTLSHSRAHMIRAVLEGVAYSLLDALEILREMNLPIGKMVVSGGGANSTLWRQILADVFETRLYIPKIKEQAAMGAILCAQVAYGKYDSLQAACDNVIEYESDPVIPNTGNFKVYREAFKAFRQSYELNEPMFK
jgi:xylulokinase